MWPSGWRPLRLAQDTTTPTTRTVEPVRPLRVSPRPTRRVSRLEVFTGTWCGSLACLASLRQVLPKRTARHGLTPATERNRGIDPQRLLKTMHQVGIGPPPPQLPAPSEGVRANSRDAALNDCCPATTRDAKRQRMLLEKRQQSIEKGGAGLRPTVERRDYRLPLLVKYYKPKGVITKMRHFSKKKDVEDLRSVVSFAGDEFELDLYHPVGQLASSSSGLLLWSRSGRVTKQLQDLRRGVVRVLEVEVWGTVQSQELHEALSSGVPLGVSGFNRTYSANVVQEACLVPESPLQELRSRVLVSCSNGRANIPAMIEKCGYKVAAVKQVQVGGFSLGQMQEGQLQAATPEEEAWACQLAGLPVSEYPEGFLPEGSQVEAATDARRGRRSKPKR